MSIVKDIYQQNQESKESTIQRVRHEVVKPTKEEQKYANLIIRKVSERFSDSSDLEKDKELIEKAVKEECSKIPDLDLEGKLRIEKTVLMTVLGNGPIDTLIDDPSVTEIVVQRFDNIVYEQGGKVNNTEIVFNNEAHLRTIISRIVQKVNRQINIANPIVDARLPDGSRVNIVLKSIALNGPVLTIRRFPKERITMRRLLSFGALTGELAAYLQTLVMAGYNIFIAGGTGSGKTTFLNALSDYIPEDARVITVEDNAELQITHIRNLVRMEARNRNVEGCQEISIRDLIKSSLRMRPDRIIVGEVRGAEAIDMIQAMNTGHDGSMSTGHANSTADMLARLETMILMGMELPLAAVRGQLASAIDIIVHLGRLRDRTRKVLEISEVTGTIDPVSGNIEVRPLFRFRETGQEEDGRITGIWEEQHVLQQTQKLEAAGLSLTSDARGSVAAPQGGRHRDGAGKAVL